MKINYNIWARYIPTILIILPIIIYVNLLINLNIVLNSINITIKYVGLNISMGGILLFFFSLIFRLLGKVLESNLFKNQELFPTTQFLLNDKISIELKKSIFNKVQEDFKIDLSTSSNIKAIIDMVGLIRNHVGDGHLVLRRNIEYGFMRNLIVGMPLVILFCILIILNKKCIEFSIIFGIYGVIAFILLLLFKKILYYLADQYARQLFFEYIGDK